MLGDLSILFVILMYVATSSPRVRPSGMQGIHFVETLHALAGRISCEDLPAEAAEFSVHDKLISRISNNDVPTGYNAADYYAALYVKASIKGFLKRAEIARLVKLYGSCSTFKVRSMVLGSSFHMSNYDNDSNGIFPPPSIPEALSEIAERSVPREENMEGTLSEPLAFGRSTLNANIMDDPLSQNLQQPNQSSDSQSEDITALEKGDFTRAFEVLQMPEKPSS